MNRALIALTAGALAVGTATVPNRADALAEWVIPVIIATGFGSAVFGAGVASAPRYQANPPVAYYPEPGAAPAVTYSAPAPQCWISPVQRPDGTMMDVRVCDRR